MDVDGAVENLVVASGHCIQKLVSAQDPPGRPGQACQQIVFDRCQVQRFFIKSDRAGVFIDMQLSKNQRLVL